MFSRITKKYLDIIVVMNATFSGGIAIGAPADLIDYPFTAMIIGFIAGMVSCFGYVYLNGLLREKLRLHDTQGVHFTHGLPGIIGGIASSIAVAFAESNFEGRYNQFFYSEATQEVRATNVQAGY